MRSFRESFQPRYSLQSSKTFPSGVRKKKLDVTVTSSSNRIRECDIKTKRDLVTSPKLFKSRTDKDTEVTNVNL